MVVGFWERYETQELIPDPFDHPETVAMMVWCSNAVMTTIEVNELRAVGTIGTIVTVPASRFEV